MTATPTRSTAAVWRRGDPVGDRRFAAIGRLDLERGGVLPDVTVAYETWGTLAPSGDNAVLVEHALTGDSHVVGDSGPGHPSPGWWPGLIGPGIGRWHGVLGGSMGGMRVLEWAAGHPDRLERALVLASTPYATADQVAWCQPQLLAIRADPAFHGGDYYGRDEWPVVGMGIARRIAHTTYRHEAELDDRFGRRPRLGEDPLGGGGRYDVESYLDHHAAKLARRFDPNSYVVLTEAMNSHDVGRGRGGLAAALAGYAGALHVAGVTTDRLYPLRLSEEIAAAHPGSVLSVIESRHGHDGFLVETEQVGGVIARSLRDG
jgi:homoserine O-acetyltransferase